jgi:hypothetical protein
MKIIKWPIFWFLIFQKKNQNLDFLNCNQPVFYESNKPDRTVLLVFMITEQFLSIFKSMVMRRMNAIIL